MLAKGVRSVTSKSQSLNYFNPSPRVSNSQGVFLSGRRTSPSACILSTSKPLAKTPTAAITLSKFAATSTARRSVGISTLQPRFKQQSPPSPTWLTGLTTLIGSSMHSPMTMKTGSWSSLTSLRLLVHLDQPLICSLPLPPTDCNRTPCVSLKHSPPLRPPSPQHPSGSYSFNIRRTLCSIRNPRPSPSNS